MVVCGSFGFTGWGPIPSSEESMPLSFVGPCQLEKRKLMELVTVINSKIDGNSSSCLTVPGQVIFRLNLRQ